MDKDYQAHLRYMKRLGYLQDRAPEMFDLLSDVQAFFPSDTETPDKPIWCDVLRRIDKLLLEFKYLGIADKAFPKEIE